MPLIRPGVFALLAVLATPAAAQTLTHSERVSIGDRQPTHSERDSFVPLCAAWQQAATAHTLSTVRGAVTTFPASIEVLPLQLISPDGKGTFQISAYPDLPHGDIAGIDFCDMMMIHSQAFPMRMRPLGIVMAMGLRLKPGVDIAMQYPTSTVELKARGQYLTLPAGRYFFVESDEIGPLQGLEGIDTAQPLFTMRGSAFGKLLDTSQ